MMWWLAPPLYILMASITSCEGKAYHMCFVKKASDLEKTGRCDRISVESNDEVMRHPKLYDRIKSAAMWINVSIINSDLERLHESDSVAFPPRSTLILKNNTKLKTMPRLLIRDPFSSEIVIWDNPQLDTSPVLNECKRKKCPDHLMDHIQMPFTCNYQLPIPEGCRNVYGDFDLTNFHESFDQVESIIGTMTLNSSNLTSFPKLKNLRAIRQRNDGPVIIIENNPELRDVKALYSLDLYTKNADDAVHVANNTNLCINFADLDQKFPLHYLGYVDRCMASSGMGIITKQKQWIIISILAIILIKNR
ncbi:hypothetical protein V3C99_007387 [Haemonchus contortus]|uniref:Recep_L_domain domain-containing protein n=1 Tax=Haemonchus contortus TaxID=6289 RepID=A0A7I5EBE6_HAECO|nr:EGF receptor domain containing protein [Haemonchus contortus]